MNRTLLLLASLVSLSAAAAACSTGDDDGRPEGPVTLAIVGDSYTEGTPLGGQGDRNWTAQLRDQLTDDGYDVRLVVEAGSGSGYISPGWRNLTFGQMTERSVPGDADIVLLFGSINDAAAGATPAEIGAAADEVYEWVDGNAADATLIVVGPSGVDENVPAEISAIRDALDGAADDADADFVDPIAEKWFFGKDAALISSDGIHPTDDGHAYMADRMLPHVEDAIDALGDSDG